MPSFTPALLIALLGAAHQSASTPVGVPLWTRDVVLPGTELEVADSDIGTPVVVRIASVAPHGSALRYDLIAYGLEPGSYDLRDYLRRVDGSSTADLPALPLAVHSVLPAGRTRPNPLQPAEVTDAGGYELLLWTGGLLWVVGLVAILVVGRGQRRADAETRRDPVTLAERLRPLVEEAIAGTLTEEDRAQLELTLIAFWRRKLALDEDGAAGSLAVLRSHPDAGPLLRQLEDWLHRPHPPEDIDVTRLLAPYRDLPAD